MNTLRSAVAAGLCSFLIAAGQMECFQPMARTVRPIPQGKNEFSLPRRSAPQKCSSVTIPRNTLITHINSRPRREHAVALVFPMLIAAVATAQTAVMRLTRGTYRRKPSFRARSADRQSAGSVVG